METVKIKKLNKWANSHSYYWVDLLRIVLGVFLITKGFAFVNNSSELVDAMAPVSNFTGGMFFFHYAAAAHIMGGIMIALGLLTRWAIWAQLPILIGAVALSMTGEISFAGFAVPFVTLMFCIFFLVFGGGKHSADYYFKLQK